MISNSEQKGRRFITPEAFAREQTERMEPPRGKLLIASCRSGYHLAAKVVANYRNILSKAGSGAEVLHLDSEPVFYALIQPGFLLRWLPVSVF